ncbi:MAG: response regulator [Candidatus Lokiarchaeota archaeon]|nr:response regulator [Candidatus Lokiarchaeota archaeon]
MRCSIIAKILVVDDDRTTLKLYKLILAEIGDYSVEFSINGKEAVDNYRIQSEKPKVIIMDHRMPVMNGFDAMNEILKIDRNTKIIFASADTMIKEHSISMGATAFLSKPFRIDELINLINKALKE